MNKFCLSSLQLNSNDQKQNILVTRKCVPKNHDDSIADSCSIGIVGNANRETVVSISDTLNDSPKPLIDRSAAASFPS